MNIQISMHTNQTTTFTGQVVFGDTRPEGYARLVIKRDPTEHDNNLSGTGETTLFLGRPELVKLAQAALDTLSELDSKAVARGVADDAGLETVTIRSVVETRCPSCFTRLGDPVPSFDQ